MKLRPVCLFGALLCASLTYAALPECVMRACLQPEIFDYTANKSWQVMSQERWEVAPLEVQESAILTTITLNGTPHPDDWMTTSIVLSAPNPTDAHPYPTQTLKISAHPTGLVPQMRLDVVLIKDAKLPPYRIQQWGNRIAIVAEAGDWYIAADEASATITQDNSADQLLTVTVANLTATREKPASVSLLVGEGPLPVAPTP